MHFSLATISALFAASTLAVPAPQGTSTPATATISFANDQTGRNAPVTASLDGKVINLFDALKGTPIGADNQVIASSAQLIRFPQNVDCAIIGTSGTQLGQLTAMKTFTKLNGALGTPATPVNLNGATLVCKTK